LSTANTLPVEGDVVLTWQVHLAKEQPKKLAVVIPATFVAAVCAFAWIQHPVFVIAMLLLVVGSLADFLFPVTYTITTTRVTVSTRAGKRIIAWKDVRKCYLDDFGVKLSPLRIQSRLEAYRGVYLRFGDKRKEVIEAVERLRSKDV
jgi:hypothetical protein